MNKENDQLRDTGLKQTKGCDLMYSAILNSATPSQKTLWMQKVLWFRRKKMQGEALKITRERTISILNTQIRKLDRAQEIL